MPTYVFRLVGVFRPMFNTKRQTFVLKFCLPTYVLRPVSINRPMFNRKRQTFMLKLYIPTIVLAPSQLPSTFAKPSILPCNPNFAKALVHFTSHLCVFPPSKTKFTFPPHTDTRVLATFSRRIS